MQTKPIDSLTKNPALNQKISLRKAMVQDAAQKNRIPDGGARVVFVLDHSGSMQRMYRDGTVQAILRGVDLDTLTVTIDELKARREALHEAIANAATPLPEFTLEQFRYILEHMAEKSEAEIFNTFVNQIILHEDTVIICINLTNKANTPPLEQILCKVGDSCQTHTLHKICSSGGVFASGWLLIAA